MTAVTYTRPFAPPRVVALCDALEWLLVAWGHKHTGKVRVTTTRPAINTTMRVWTNKPPFDAMPEAELVIDIYPDGRPDYSRNGSPRWVFSAADESPTVVLRVLREIVGEGWQVQGLDAEGVGVARVTTWGTR